VLQYKGIPYLAFFRHPDAIIGPGDELYVDYGPNFKLPTSRSAAYGIL
jgi:hypothetical protein